jgi:hypothetical protein
MKGRAKMRLLRDQTRREPAVGVRLLLHSGISDNVHHRASLVLRRFEKAAPIEGSASLLAAVVDIDDHDPRHAGRIRYPNGGSSGIETRSKGMLVLRLSCGTALNTCTRQRAAHAQNMFLLGGYSSCCDLVKSLAKTSPSRCSMSLRPNQGGRRDPRF